MLMRGVGQELHVDAGVVRGTADGALPPLHALAVNTRRDDERATVVNPSAATPRQQSW